MRLFLLAACCLPGLGCSMFINTSGVILRDLETRDQVRRAFGEPVAAGTKDGQAFEEYWSRRKVAEVWNQEYAIFAFVGTLGLSELILFPHAVYRQAVRLIGGQRVRAVYDAEGRVVSGSVEGCSEPWRMPQ